MLSLTEIKSYSKAHECFTKEALWSLFDGNSDKLNIGYECVDRHQPERLAIRVTKDDWTHEEITFGELADLSNRFSNWLIGQGIQKGDRIAIMLEPSLEFYSSLYGTMKIGAVPVPLFTLFGTEGLRLRLQDCSPRIIVTTAELATKINIDDRILKVIIDDGQFWINLRHESKLFESKTTADDMAMYQYTSGTTRELPEAVKHHHRAIITVMIAALYGIGLRPGDRYMCPSSPAWGHGLWHGTLAPMALGIEINSYAGRFNPQLLFNTLLEKKVTNLSAAATHYRMMKNADCGPAQNNEIEKLSFTGEPIDSDTEAWVFDTFGKPICSMYGTTEVGVVLASYPGAPDFQVIPGSLGKPVPGVELDVHDKDGHPCQTGQTGEIVVKRRGQWISIKDLGHRDKYGYWWHDGRSDDVIISAGWTMSAKEIENTLLTHPNVDEAAVIAVEDAQRGQIAKAFIVSSRNSDTPFFEEIINFTKQQLAQHEYPRQIEIIESIPKTPAGKVNRKALRELQAKLKDDIS